ncbi:MAG TPA: TonB-dependent receptor [Gammaproteobacteria bacterium]
MTSSSKYMPAVAAAIVLPGLLLVPEARLSAQALEEVVVTARRVAESLQEVPISIVAFSGDELALRGIERGEDMMMAVPNVVMTGAGLTTSSSDITIRGMPNVGIYLDGVAQSSTGLLQSSFVELERMEVLRGPQGTLFGRNSNGGAIQLITKRPAAEFGARVKAEFGEYSRQDLSAAIDLPLSDTLLSKFTIGSYTQDGQVCSLTVPACYGGKDDEVFRADFLWTPSEDFDLRVAYDYQRTESSDRKAVLFTNPNHVRIAALNIAANGLAMGAFSPETTNLIEDHLPITEYTQRSHEPGFPGGEVGKWETKGDGPENGISTDFDALTVTFNWDITDNISLESISAWWEKQGHNYRDIRGAEVIEAVEDDVYTWDQVVSQEFHLTGVTDSGRITWLAGLWYQDYDDRNVNYRWPVPWARQVGQPGPGCRAGTIAEVQAYVRNPANWNVGHTDYGAVQIAGGSLATFVPTTGMPPSGPACDGDPIGEENQDYALFGEVGFALSDRLNLALGVRWSDRDATNVAFDRTGVPGSAIKPDLPGPIVGDVWAASVVSKTDEPDASVWFTPKVSLDYQWTDDVMVYGSYAEGFTSAEVTVSGTAGVVEVDPETVETIEFGIHSDWLDGTLRFNGSIFFTDWVNIRTSINPTDPITGQVITAAVEITGGNAEASGIDMDLTWRPSENWYVNVGVGLLDTEYKDLGPDVPISEGQRFPNAPDLMYTVTAQYDWNLTSGSQLSLRGDYRYMDEYVMHSRLSAQVLQPGCGLSSARLTYQPASQEWSAYLYGSNLADKQYWNSGFVGGAGGLFLAQLGPRQEYGAGLTFFFD